MPNNPLVAWHLFYEGIYIYIYLGLSGQISIIPKPELRGFWGSSLIKPPFRVTSADVVIICPDIYTFSDGLTGQHVVLDNASISSG